MRRLAWLLVTMGCVGETSGLGLGEEDGSPGDAVADTTAGDDTAVTPPDTGHDAPPDTLASDTAPDATTDSATPDSVVLDSAALDSAAMDTAPDAIVDSGPLPSPTGAPGALVGVAMDSRVGVLLDEIPASMRDRVAAALVAKPPSFWIERATEQTRLTTYRLVFRQYFYGGPRAQLPLPPPRLWNITLKGAPLRTTVSGHDLVVVDYALASTLLTDPASPGKSEPKLGSVGGTWDEPFEFPIDPELVFQRTRYACMDEEDFPPNSVDSEEVDSFYDQECKVEKKLSPHGQCHQTELPTMSCIAALDARIGRVSTKLRFTRLPWDAARADAVRAGPITSKTGADLKVVEEELRSNRLIYRYIPPGSCTLLEKCVGGPGWRRLLQFSTSDQNVGLKTLDIGPVDYYLSGAGGPLADHGIFELDACHQHYHFMHYGSFTYGTTTEGITNKRGFCLQSTNRYGNHELSPLHNPYGGCDYQGIEVGWVDQYKAGLECQWVDVTSVDTKTAPATRSLKFHSNPDGFLCEGTPVRDASGNIVWERTSFTTADGKPVDRMKCDFSPGWDANNVDAYNVTLPTDGDGYVTKACTRGQIGPLRNCSFQIANRKTPCTAGSKTTVRCSVPAGSAPQVVRMCETSAVLGTPIPCTYQESLPSVPVESGGVDVTFTCPAARSATEPGGAYALYTAPVFDDDARATVTCVAK